MLKILLEKWGKNKNLLREKFEQGDEFNSCEYLDLVKLTFNTIYNDEEDVFESERLNVEEITEIDNGNYQGTLLYLIPFCTYQPHEYEYLMTFVGYGSCSGCDTLLSIQSFCHGDKQKLTKSQIDDFMTLCKDIVTNTIKPYNSGWRTDEQFKEVKADD